jgi:5S rRNA maturation endonuclease (ribonuclease M5)
LIDVPDKKIRKTHEELHRYYLQVITFQDKDSQYQEIATKFSKNLSELEDIIEDIRIYNNNSKNNPLIHIFK